MGSRQRRIRHPPDGDLSGTERSGRLRPAAQSDPRVDLSVSVVPTGTLRPLARRSSCQRPLLPGVLRPANETSVHVVVVETMKRSGPIRRDLDATRAFEKRSRQAIPSRSPRRRDADAKTAELRATVSARRCLLADLAFGSCAGGGTPHHLRKASAGGTTTPENLVPLCAFHNSWVENEPVAARIIGLVVRPGIDHAEARSRRIARGFAS